MQTKLYGSLYPFDDTISLPHFLNPKKVLIFKAYQFRNSILRKDIILKCKHFKNYAAIAYAYL